MIQKIFLFISFCVISHLLNAQALQRIEPPNWWIGMKDQRLQIMVYGDHVGKLQAKAHYKGVRLIKSPCPENDNYLFIDLTINPKTKAGEIPILLFDHNRQITRFNYPILSREFGSAERPGITSSDVIYLITPDRFANGD